MRCARRPETAGALTVVWLPPGVKSPATIERDADESIRAGGARRKEANVRADVRTVRVMWDESRALIYASPATFALRSTRSSGSASCSARRSRWKRR